ncbi:MAG TPA: cohesin domain-containing protein [Dongiaceae bacterium]|nr:cohesin domain-containing protein [Dongiaceae bacterium]
MGRGRVDRRLPRAAGSASLLLVALLALSCGGGGGGGSDALPCTTLTFDRALSTLANGDVYLDQASGTCSTVGVGVLVNNLSRIWTVSFDLNFPSSLLTYDSFTLGPLLQKGSPASPPLVFVTQVGSTVQVTMTRLLPDPPIDAVGSEALITIRFQRVAAGSGAIDFNTSGSSPVGEVVLDELGGTRPATFAPGHGGMVMVP